MGVVAKAAGPAGLFPGQGSQRPGMAELVTAQRPDLLEAAVEQIGEDPFPLVEEDTRFAQVAIFCTSLAAWELVSAPRPRLLAGHSLGELSALVAGGALDAREGVKLVAIRGSLMSEAAREHPGCMLVVRAEIGEAERLAAENGLEVANHNAPDQVALTGSDDAAGSLERAAADRGIPCRRLRVRGAFHTPAMAGAASKFSAVLREAAFRQPQATVYSGSSAAPFVDPARELAAALTSRVRWVETMTAIEREGVSQFIDVGPGKVMSGLARKCVPAAHVELNAPLSGAAGAEQVARDRVDSRRR